LVENQKRNMKKSAFCEYILIFMKSTETGPCPSPRLFRIVKMATMASDACATGHRLASVLDGARSTPRKRKKSKVKDASHVRAGHIRAVRDELLVQHRRYRINADGTKGAAASRFQEALRLASTPRMLPHIRRQVQL
jgi:hypothetical protein